MNTAKPKSEVLVEMMTVLHRHDPMGLNAPEDEYESEALSILARYNEAGFHVAEKEEALPIAIGMVREVFSFWFGGVPGNEIQWDSVSNELLDVYLAGYPSSVEHVTIG